MAVIVLTGLDEPQRRPGRAAKSDPGPGDVHVPTAAWQRPTLRQRLARRRHLPPHAGGALLRADNRVVKAEPTRQLLTGWASIIEEADGTPHVDSQGDIIDEAELVQAAQDYMRGSRVVCDNHRRVPRAGGGEEPLRVGTTVESLVVTRALKAALGLPPTTPTGWLVTMHIEDPVVWAEVAAGQRAGLSIGGAALREPVA